MKECTRHGDFKVFPLTITPTELKLSTIKKCKQIFITIFIIYSILL